MSLSFYLCKQLRIMRQLFKGLYLLLDVNKILTCPPEISVLTQTSHILYYLYACVGHCSLFLSDTLALSV